jgi:hypothetical protein
VDAASRHVGWWGDQRAATHPRSIVELIAAGTLDAELAALLWLLVGARVPLVVAGPPGSGRTTVLSALLDLLPAAADIRILAGDAEDFGWLPEAARLGWRGSASATAGAPVAPADRAATVMRAGRLGDLAPDDLRGGRLRTAIRALSLGYGLAATIDGGSLEDVFERLGAPDAGLTGDELSHLGVVLVMRHFVSGDGAPDRRRVAAAHYVRPLSRDAGGHVQRLGPAVLATWDERRDAFEHFAWGIVPELAGRAGRRPGDFEADQARRVEFLAGLVATGVTDLEQVRRAIAGFATVSAIGRSSRTDGH